MRPWLVTLVAGVMLLNAERRTSATRRARRTTGSTATWVVSATPRRGNKAVTVELCVDSASTWQAGTYEGTVTIDGPRLRQFAYSVVITKKWPWWSAFLVLVAVVFGYILYAAGRDQAPAAHAKTGAIRTKLIYLAVSATGGLLVYWSVGGAQPAR